MVVAARNVSLTALFWLLISTNGNILKSRKKKAVVRAIQCMYFTLISCGTRNTIYGSLKENVALYS